MERTPTAADESVAEKIVSLVGRHHYSHPEFNDAVSAELFDAYLRRLDPERMYFLQSDIDEFTPYREILDDTLARKGTHGLRLRGLRPADGAHGRAPRAYEGPPGAAV